VHALDWLGDLIHVVSLVIPRLVLVRRTHAGVLYCRDKVKAVGPGVTWYWPVWSEIQLICTVRQTLNLSYQCLFCRDGSPIVVAAIVVYRIESAVDALTTTDQIVDTIHDVAMAAIRRVVTACTFKEIHENKTEKGKSIDSMLRHRLQADLSTYGVSIERSFLCDISKPVIVRLLSDVASN
jgi:regulator of protease activity HflC (stomatin/prohibitin superfamily)